MKKFLLMACVLIIAFITVSCGNNESQLHDPPAGNNSIIDDNAEETTVENLMRDLTEKNYISITELFYFGNLPFTDVEVQDGVPIAKVVSDDYKSLDDIKDFLSSVYTQEEVERLLNNYFDERPLYFEKDHKLYLYVDQTTSAGIPLRWKSFEIEIKSFDDKVCVFEAVVEYDDEMSTDSNRYVFEAVNNNGWRLNSIVKNPE